MSYAGYFGQRSHQVVGETEPDTENETGEVMSAT